MIPWWCILIALGGGAVLGAMVMGLCAANTVSEGRKWWEEDGDE